MEEVLGVIKEQIKSLEGIQGKYEGLERNDSLDKFILISQQINELSKTYLDIKKATITKF